MSQPDQFAKETFAEETERLTGGAVTWQEASESQIERVQCDGLLVVHRPERLARLPAPWPEARSSEELIVELKLGATTWTCSRWSKRSGAGS